VVGCLCWIRRFIFLFNPFLVGVASINGPYFSLKSPLRNALPDYPLPWPRQQILPLHKPPKIFDDNKFDIMSAILYIWQYCIKQLVYPHIEIVVDVSDVLGRWWAGGSSRC
jgi:hypothetical protein